MLCGYNPFWNRSGLALTGV